MSKTSNNIPQYPRTWATANTVDSPKSIDLGTLQKAPVLVAEANGIIDKVANARQENERKIACFKAVQELVKAEKALEQAKKDYEISRDFGFSPWDRLGAGAEPTLRPDRVLDDLTRQRVIANAMAEAAQLQWIRLPSDSTLKQNFFDIKEILVEVAIGLAMEVSSLQFTRAIEAERAYKMSIEEATELVNFHKSQVKKLLDSGFCLDEHEIRVHRLTLGYGWTMPLGRNTTSSLSGSTKPNSQVKLQRVDQTDPDAAAKEAEASRRPYTALNPQTYLATAGEALGAGLAGFAKGMPNLDLASKPSGKKDGRFDPPLVSPNNNDHGGKGGSPYDKQTKPKVVVTTESKAPVSKQPSVVVGKIDNRVWNGNPDTNLNLSALEFTPRAVAPAVVRRLAPESSVVFERPLASRADRSIQPDVASAILTPETGTFPFTLPTFDVQAFGGNLGHTFDGLVRTAKANLSPWVLGESRSTNTSPAPAVPFTEANMVSAVGKALGPHLQAAGNTAVAAGEFVNSIPNGVITGFTILGGGLSAWLVDRAQGKAVW